MKTLALIVLVALSVHGQELLSADGAKWSYIATGRDRDGKQFNVFARRIENTAYSELEIKFGHSPRISAEHDCKRKVYRFKGGEWAKPSPRSVGAVLVKFACRK